MKISKRKNSIFRTSSISGNPSVLFHMPFTFGSVQSVRQSLALIHLKLLFYDFQRTIGPINRRRLEWVSFVTCITGLVPFFASTRPSPHCWVYKEGPKPLQSHSIFPAYSSHQDLINFEFLTTKYFINGYNEILIKIRFSKFGLGFKCS